MNLWWRELDLTVLSCLTTRVWARIRKFTSLFDYNQLMHQ